MRAQHLVEVKGMTGNDYNFTLSVAGKQLASERFQVSQYAGACPVSLKEYYAATKAQAAKVQVDRRVLRQAFSDLVVSDRMLDQLGPAIISQNSIFVYGPTGNGKTSLAERMLRVYQDAILIPYAVEVDNQIISLYDPVVHQPIENDDQDMDQRWILCKRPCILVGGELIPSMLELRLDEGSGIYAAPLQMKANNGILLIDDFGRTLGHHLLAWSRCSSATGSASASQPRRRALAARRRCARRLDAAAAASADPMRNSIDAVSDRDFALDYLYAVGSCFTHLSRIGEELVLWTTSEFGFARLPEEAATGSSMMPQKLNADVAELARGKAGTAIGRLTGLLATVKGLPLAYNRDLQEDKQAVFAARADLAGALGALAVLVAGLASTATVSPPRAPTRCCARPTPPRRSSATEFPSATPTAGRRLGALAASARPSSPPRGSAM